VSSPFNNNTPFIWLSGPGATTVKLMGSGFASTDTNPVTPSMPLTSLFFVNAAEWDIGLGFDTLHYRPGFYTLGDCNNAGCANPPASFAFLADGLSRLGMGSDGRFAMTDLGNLHMFSANGIPIGTPFAVGNAATTVAFDSANNLVAVARSSAGPIGLFDITKPPAVNFAPANVTGSVTEVVQLDGTGCAAQPDEGKVTIFPMDNTVFTSISSPAGAAGSKPWSVAMVHVGTELDCVSISPAEGKLTWTNTADGSTSGTTTLAGISATSTPHVVAFEGGAQAGTIAVFSPQDNLAVFVNSSTKTEIRRVTLPSSTTTHVTQVAADPTGGNLILMNATVNSTTASQGFMKLVVASGAQSPTGPNSTSSTLFTDVAVSPASANIVGGSFAAPHLIPIQ
jgi:hypothetical protein